MSDQFSTYGAGLKTGAQQEQTRIINLLEADCKDGLGDQIQGCSHEVAIALIKGENATNFTGSTLPISQQEDNLGNSTVHTSAYNPVTDTHCDDCNDFGCHGCSCADVEGYCGTCGKDDK